MLCNPAVAIKLPNNQILALHSEILAIKVPLATFMKSKKHVSAAKNVKVEH